MRWGRQNAAPARLPDRLVVTTLQHLFALTAPLFLLVLLGYGLIRWARWAPAIGEALTRFVFSVAVPVLLFVEPAAEAPHTERAEVALAVVDWAWAGQSQALDLLDTVER